MAGMKPWRDAERLFAVAGLQVVDHRQGGGSHRVCTLGYRGFCKAMTIPGMAGNYSVQKNRAAELERFKRLVDATLSGETSPLPAGVWRA